MRGGHAKGVWKTFRFSPLDGPERDPKARNTLVPSLAEKVGNDPDYVAAGRDAYSAVRTFVSDARSFIVIVRAAEKG